jgi:hypothetical protein
MLKNKNLQVSKKNNDLISNLITTFTIKHIDWGILKVFVNEILFINLNQVIKYNWGYIEKFLEKFEIYEMFNEITKS